MLVKKQESTKETWAKLFASRAVLNSLPLHQKLICLPVVEGCKNAPLQKGNTLLSQASSALSFLLKKRVPTLMKMESLTQKISHRDIFKTFPL